MYTLKTVVGTLRTVVGLMFWKENRTDVQCGGTNVQVSGACVQVG